MPPILPEEIWELIYQHNAAISLQRSLRVKKYPYVHNEDWCELRRLLVARLRDEEWKLLVSNCWIRREWRQEPRSWIYMLNHEPSNLSEIVEECRERKSKVLASRICQKWAR